MNFIVNPSFLIKKMGEQATGFAPVYLQVGNLAL